MTEPTPFRISVYDGTFDPLDGVGAPLEVHVTKRHAAPSFASFALDADDEQVGVLTAPGSRCVLEYQHDPLDPDAWLFLLSGAIGEREGESSIAGTRTFEVLDDWAYVLNLVGVPNPAGTILEQGDEDAYYTVTGPAETVAKTHIAAAAAWHGVPVTVAPSLGRGDTITVSVRFHKLVDRLLPAVTQAGIGITVEQSGSTLVVDCYEPDVLAEPLTEESGVVVGGKFYAHPPTVTRVIALGQGVGTARQALIVVNTAVEAEWNLRLCAVIDTRDTNDTDVMTERAWEVLREGAPQAGVVAELAETADFRFGITVNVGDVAPVQLLGAPLIEDTVTEAVLDWTADDGLIVTPHVGEVMATFEEITAAAVEQLAARTRDQDARS